MSAASEIAARVAALQGAGADTVATATNHDDKRAVDMDRLSRLRGLHVKWSLDYGAGVWELLQLGRQEDAEDCAWWAWAHLEAAKADDPRVRFDTLHAERYGRERPHLRLVVDNTREGAGGD